MPSSDDHGSTASERLHELEVHRSAPGRYVLRVGDEIRACSDRELPDALQQALGLGMEDALALARAVRSNAS